MLFNSLDFLVFFPAVAILYYALRERFRWVLLLLASYFFYMCWRPEYIVLILFSTVVDYFVSLRLAGESRRAVRRLYLCASLGTNLGLLFVFKYFNFANDAFRSLFSSANAEYPVPDLDFLLPVGISFYTFQTLSYTIDVYRGAIKPERHAGIFALYVSFFPQLVAGPIERAGRLLPQFRESHPFGYARTVSGLQRMAWGFFKKVVIADRLAPMVNTVYADPTQYTGIPLIVATYAFAFQIYCDFSGYSDIAIGAARVLGFDLMENFRQPYYARSIPEFWQRWHISLSTWFRDYVYIPLGGNRVALSRRCFNVIVVFVVSGLWHGANWTFLVWGALHGVYMLAGRAWSSFAADKSWGAFLPAGAVKALEMLLTFHLVVFSWIFFRASSLSDALYVVTHLFSGLSFDVSGHGIMPGGVYEMAIAAFAVLIMESVHILQARTGAAGEVLQRQPLWVRWPAYWCVCILIVAFGKFGLREFIYFQF